MNKKAIVFGTGTGAERVLRVMPSNYRVIAFADNNSGKHGLDFYGKEIIDPKRIDSLNPDVVVVASSFFDEILSQLVKLGISEEKIERVSPEVLLGDYEIDSKKIWKFICLIFLLGLALYGAVRLFIDAVGLVC